MSYYNYLITSTETDKFYIGFASNIENRWSHHKYNTLKTEIQSHLYRSMRKHGIDTFKISELESYETEKEALDGETFWIAYYKSIGAELLNMTDGGEGQSGHRWTEDRRANYILKKTGKKLPPCSEERKLKISIANKGKNMSILYKPIIATDENGLEMEFASLKLASEIIGVSDSAISSALTGRQKRAACLFWKYKEKEIE